MEWLNSVLSFLSGIGLRLLVPITLTALVIYFLRRLDNRWQAQASRQVPVIAKPECWKIKGCPDEKRKTCKGAQAKEPCWQVFRQPNGYMKEDCLGCDVFRQAPAPIQI